MTFSADEFLAHFSDPDGDELVSVRIESLPSNGTLMLNGMALTVGQEIARADLDHLVFLPALNFHGTTSFTYTASDGIAGFALTPATVTLQILSVEEQADRIANRIDELVAEGVLNEGQGEALKLNLKDNRGDAGKVQAFLHQVEAFVLAGILTQEQADELLSLGTLLLNSVTIR